MIEKNKYLYLWGCCEYFLAHADSGVNLIAFDLIRETYQGTATRDAYVYERLTRPVLAQSSRGIKRLVQDYVERDRLGQLEGTIKSLEDSLKANVQEIILRHLETAFEAAFIREIQAEDLPEVFLVLAAIYHAYYKDRETTKMVLPPWFTGVFCPLVTTSQKGDPHRLEEWKIALGQRFSRLWQEEGSPGEKLTAFFEHRVTRKIISYTLAGVVDHLQKEKEKAGYFFEVTHRLSVQDMKYFQFLMVNGLSGVLNKEKRFSAPTQAAETVVRIGVLPRDQMKGVVDAVVDTHFDPALDLCVQYFLSVAKERPKGKLDKQFETAFLAMNRAIWKELLNMADTRRRILFRTRHLLRVVIHYLFETRKIDRKFWQKYISSIDRILHFTFEEEGHRFRQYNARLGRQLSQYRNFGKYQDTDWEGFYNDAACRAVALEAIREVAGRARSDRDPALPAVWFSNLMENGVDDQALYRFFRQGPGNA